MNIVERRPKVALGFHARLGAIEPDFAAALVVFAVPFKSGSPMKPSNLVKQLRQFPRQNQRMIMIRQNAPRINLFATSIQNLQQSFREDSEPFGIQADAVAVLITRGGQ